VEIQAHEVPESAEVECDPVRNGHWKLLAVEELVLSDMAAAAAEVQH
jgi:hypothetical protein